MMDSATAPLPTSARPLDGRCIVVTRPAHQAGALAARISKAGGTPVLFPVIEILDVEDSQPLMELIARLSRFDLAVFVSPNAVNKAMNAVATHRGWPPGLRAAAVGKGSARELRRRGIPGVIAPEDGFDSEALLALPEMQDVAAKRVVIFRGAGGRELLGDTLLARGASVEYAECYRRARPSCDAEGLFELWARQQLSGFVVTSSEGLRNLVEMAGERGRQRLAATPLFVTHPRIAETAHALGMSRVIRTRPGDEGIVQGLIDWWGVGCAPLAAG
jgi:uroporphyrinogen-III synthase